MKNISKFFAAGFLTMGVCACSSDEGLTAQNGNSYEGESIYLRFNLDFPGSRGTTKGDSTEVGTDKENKVSDVKIVLVDPTDNTVIAVSNPDNLQLVGNTYVAPFKAEDLYEWANNAGGEKKPLQVLVCCNVDGKDASTTQMVGQNFDVNAKYELSADDASTSLWADNHFLMTNANDVDLNVELPNKKDLIKYDRPEYSFNLGTISVERVAARFDVSNEKTRFVINGTETDPEVEIQLADLGLFNLSKACYTFRRVSDDGMNAATTVKDLFGQETHYNYVVDVNPDNESDYFYRTAPAWQTLASLGTGAGYHVWRYVTENTNKYADHQKQGMATGVSFKGYIEAGSKCEASLKSEIENAAEAIYVYQDVLYGSWARVNRAANEGFVNGVDGAVFTPNATLKSGFDLAQEYQAQGMTPVEAAKKAGFQVYEPTSGKYEVYYNYYNRHQNNNDNFHSGVMEFAVVRNNVYKLKVSSIDKFGAPEYEVPDDNTDIEKADAYFKVDVKVIPWVVKKNDIEL